MGYADREKFYSSPGARWVRVVVKPRLYKADGYWRVHYYIAGKRYDTCNIRDFGRACEEAARAWRLAIAMSRRPCTRQRF